MSSQTILGFDVGSHKIGVAVGESLLGRATPLKRLIVQRGLLPLDEIKKLIQQWRPDVLVVGMPTHMDGRRQFTTDLAVAFIDCLKQHTKIPICPIDERLTTKAARSELFEQGGFKKLNSADIDSYAAKLIIESWMNEQQRNG
jgi:putative Holliday junction resolvase